MDENEAVTPAPPPRRTDELMSFFDFAHLPDHLKGISGDCCGLAASVLGQLPDDSAELTAGLRHLLEAKDCFVRARILGTR